MPIGPIALTLPNQPSPDEPESDAGTWLLGDEASESLRVIAASELPSHQLTQQLRRHLTADQTHSVLELAELRRRGLRKFTQAANMYFNRIGFEQATDEWIARYKAQRFAGKNVIDLCCGIGGDAIGLYDLAASLRLCDRSPTAVAYASQNLRAYYNIPPNSLIGDVSDVESIPLRNCDAWHIDPDRRPGGRRGTHAELHEPSDSSVDRLLACNPHAAIKLAPGCEVPSRWQANGELEWISRNGECKQLVVWLGDLTTLPGQRRATVLKTDGQSYQVVRTITGSEVELPYGNAIDRYVFEPDAAILASGLVGALSHEHGWRTFASTTGYLTGSAITREPACAAFEVIDVVPLQVKKLGRYLREHHIGHVEIKLRSIDVSPDKLRKELKLKGDCRATLLLTRIGEKRIAIVADRISMTDLSNDGNG